MSCFFDVAHFDVVFQVNVKLSETDTIWHLDMPGISVSKDSDIAEEVRMRNKKYEEVQKLPLDSGFCEKD